MKRLIIGASGFMGSHLARRLIAGGADVVLLDRTPPSYEIGRDIRVRIGDYGDPNVLAQVLDGVSLVYHLACTTVPGTAQENPYRDVEENLLPTLRLLDACAKNGVQGFFFPSSGGTVYGIAQKLPIREDHPANPISAYGITKLAIEHYIRSCHKLYGIGGGIFRVGNLYGPGQNPGRNFGAVAVFMHHILAGKPIRIWGDGSAVRDYIHVDDLIRAILRWEEGGMPSGTFNIGTGIGTSLNDLIRLIEDATGRRAQRVYEDARPCDLPANVLDGSLAMATFGWKANVSLPVGIDNLTSNADAGS